jgi:DNA-binding transcriptional LysR family regulator
VLRDFAEAFPSVSLRLRMEAIGGVAQLVTEGVCTLGLAGGPGLVGDHLERQPIGAITLLPVVAPTHPLAKLPRITRVDARDHVQLVLSDASKLTEGQDFGVIALKTWRLGDLGAKHALLLAGLGWGNMPEHLVANDLASGRLTKIMIDGETGYTYNLHLIHRTDRPPGRAGAWLADRLRASSEPSAWPAGSAPWTPAGGDPPDPRVLKASEREGT